jgi:CDP-diacylglycerol--glycerol-3-phosphate 3-phosphatidyltransferase
VTTVSQFSYPLAPNGTLGTPPCGIDPIGVPDRFKTAAGAAVRAFLTKAADVSTEPPPPKAEPDGAPVSGEELVLDGKVADTWVLPTVQMGPLGVRQDELATLRFIRQLPGHSQVHLSSAYFNLAQPYEKALLEALREEVRVKIVTAAPSANGFYGSRGPSGLIPGAYSLMEQRLYERAGGDDQSRLEIYEYSREGWTFHAKGLWLSTSTQVEEELQRPSVTTIGSPNFGYRSLDKDLECQLWLLTSHKSLRDQLGQERDRLSQQSARISQSTFQSGDRRATTLVKVAAALSKGHL